FLFFFFFFFSSRRRHTRSKRDWSSDVCSSDLLQYRGDGDGGLLLRTHDPEVVERGGGQGMGLLGFDPRALVCGDGVLLRTSMLRCLRWLPVVLLLACLDAFAPAGAVPFTPPVVYRAWWTEIESCAGLLGDFDLRPPGPRSEEHTSELQSRFDLVCRLLLEKKKKKKR